MKNAILGSAQVLAEKMFQRLSRLDEEQFPTPATIKARTLITEGIKAILHSARTQSPAPKVVYMQLVSLGNLLGTVERSQCAMVSWPIARSYDTLWNKLDKGHVEGIFFSQRHDHHYTTTKFNKELSTILESTVTKESLEVFESKALHCMALASLEEDNVPMHANLAHEFGHILCDLYSDSIASTRKDKLYPAKNEMATYIKSKSRESERNNRVAIVGRIIERLASEIIADVVASLLVGPSFQLSLNETSWCYLGKNIWNVMVRSRSCTVDNNTHPSFTFRQYILDTISPFITVQNELIKVDSIRGGIYKQQLESCMTLIEAYNEENERPEVKATIEKDQVFFQGLLQSCQKVLLSSLRDLAKQINHDFKELIPGVVFNPQWETIYDLIDRLAHDIPPNIIPIPGDMLGKRADFQSIILAASIYRQFVFTRADKSTTNKVGEDLSKLDRLTAKAIEATYLHEYYEKNRYAEGKE